MRNLAKEKLGSGDTVQCLCVRMARSVDIGAVAAGAGFDALYVDMEHSAISADDAAGICAAAPGFGVTPLVRVPEGALGLAARLLDNGALGVIMPHVETGSGARAVADACRFPPQGTRSAAGSTVQLGFQPMKQDAIAAGLNDLVLVCVMIETPLGVKNADAIAATEGIDMVMVGTNDLSAAMGQTGNIDGAGVRAACETVAAACAAHGKAFALGGVRGNAALVRDYVAMGARFIIAGTDTIYLTAAARDDIAAIRATLGAGA
ncbi:MAG: aldolase/citrate lyase family protein [Alphaproteobacteria bacterium]